MARSFSEAVAAFEAALLRAALTETQHNQRAAAARLGLEYHQLRHLLKKHGGRLDRPGVR
jgi:psp operon transcriptional activator